MVSLAYLITILFTFAAVVRSEEVANDNKNEVDAKWLGFSRLNTIGGWGMGGGMFCSGFGVTLSWPWLNPWINTFNGGCFGTGMLGGLYNNFLFAKAADDHSVSRRAVALDANQLYRRASEESATCINQDGVSATFLKSDCLSAASQLSKKKVSSATYGHCTLSLVSPKDRVAPNEVDPTLLQKAVDNLLKGCSTPSKATQTKAATTSKEPDDQQIALLLSKPPSH